MVMRNDCPRDRNAYHQCFAADEEGGTDVEDVGVEGAEVARVEAVGGDDVFLYQALVGVGFDRAIRADDGVWMQSVDRGNMGRVARGQEVRAGQRPVATPLSACGPASVAHTSPQSHPSPSSSVPKAIHPSPLHATPQPVGTTKQPAISVAPHSRPTACARFGRPSGRLPPRHHPAHGLHVAHQVLPAVR